MRTPDRRKLILDVAARLFRHYGHEKTNMTEIAREVGVAVGTVYLDFPSKDAILAELSNVAHVQVVEAMRAAAAKHVDAALGRRLHAVIGARLGAFLDVARGGQHACDLIVCGADGVKSAHGRFRDAEKAIFEQVLADARERGELVPSADPSATAALVQLAFVSLSPPTIFRLERDVAVKMTRALADLLLTGLELRSGASGASGAAGARTAKRARR